MDQQAYNFLNIINKTGEALVNIWTAGTFLIGTMIIRNKKICVKSKTLKEISPL